MITIAAAALAVALAAPVPGPTGWAVTGAPNSRILPFDVGQLDEDKLLRSGRKAALYALASGPDGYHRERPPLVLVHGIQGHPRDLQAVIDRLKATRYQLYVFAYDDWKTRTSLSGNQLADELRNLTGYLGKGRDLAIVAHSMGGIVTRQALNQLSYGARRGLERFRSAHVIAIDTPWHGYGGPGDRGIEGAFMAVARPFMPDALEDMRARSAMFQGDPKSKDPVARVGLLQVVPPSNLTIDLAFAQEGKDIHDYTEAELVPYAQLLAGYFLRESKIGPDPMVINFHRALVQSSAWFPFQDAMRAQADRGSLEAAAVRAGLERFFPRFPGDHTGVLREQSRKPTFLDWMMGKLR